MRYVNIATDATFNLLASSFWEACEASPVRYLSYVELYYSKISDPNARDLKPRRLVPLEWYESKAGRLLARCYDRDAGFVKSFRIDQIQRIKIRNQNLPDNGWGVTDISIHQKVGFKRS